MLKGLVVAMLVATGVQHDEMIMSKKALEDAGAQVHLVAFESDTFQAWDWYA